MAEYGPSGDNFGCVQRRGRAAAARDSGVSGRPGAVGQRDRGCAGNGAAGGFEATAGAAGSGAGADAVRGTAEAVPDQRVSNPPAARLDERVRALLAAHADEGEGARGGQNEPRSHEREGETGMSIAEALMAEFDEQAPLTRKFLERLPEERMGWKPHERSLTAGQLALHLAQVPGAVAQLVRENPAQIPRMGGPTTQPATVDEILRAHDAGVAATRQELAQHNDAAMSQVWHLQVDGRDLLAMPRGQFSIYLRMLNIPVPSTWGPSADEAPAFIQKQTA